MNRGVRVFEQFTSAFNRLGLWNREQLVWGKRMRAKTFDRSLYLWMHRHGFMGKSDMALMARIVRPGWTAVDVGANMGLYSLFLGGLVGPGGRVIAFEPDPDLFGLLRDNCAANGARNVEPHAAALGAKADRLVLHRLTLNSGENYLGSQTQSAFRRPVEVDVVSLDALYPSLRPDFVKIDVQGWELNVLRGMEKTLSNSDAIVFLEFWPDGLARAGSRAADLFAFVRGLGFNIYASDDGRLLTEAAFLSMAVKVTGMNYVNLLASRSAPPKA